MLRRLAVSSLPPDRPALWMRIEASPSARRSSDSSIRTTWSLAIGITASRRSSSPRRTTRSPPPAVARVKP
jgi:hypothetical protein